MQAKNSLPQQSENEWLTIREAAANVPGRPHESTVARWTLRDVRNKKLPSTLIGGRRLVKRSDLLAFLAENGEQPQTSGENKRHAAATAQAAELLK